MEDIKALLEKEQEVRNARLNTKRTTPRSFDTGDKVFISNKQIKAKQKPLYKEETIAENRNATILTQTGKNSTKQM